MAAWLLGLTGVSQVSEEVRPLHIALAVEARIQPRTLSPPGQPLLPAQAWT